MFCVAIVGVMTAHLLACTSAQAEPDKVVGKRWEYVLSDDKVTCIESGVYKAIDGKLLKGDTEIGTYQEKDKGRTISVEVTRGELKGKIELKLTHANTYKGELIRPNGKKYRVDIVVKEK